MTIRFQCAGQVKDLDEAITYNCKTLALRPPGHPNHSSLLINLANATRIHYNQMGQMEDFEEAITHYHNAPNLVPPEHPSRSICLTNLASSITKLILGR
jgi:hypothetical protein